MENAPEFCLTLRTVDQQMTPGLGWVQQETVSTVQISTFVEIKISNTQGTTPVFGLVRDDVLIFGWSGRERIFP